MKKSSFVALVMGTVSGILFALGMCMTLIPEWDTFQQGMILGGVGIFLGLITSIIWRKMTHKPPIQFSGKTILTIIVCIIGILALGIGMCFCMVWNQMMLGIVIGLVGIVILISLIPLIKGFTD